MVSLLSALNMTGNTLSVNEKAISVVSHNVANMNTDGYHKQRANLVTRNIAGAIGNNVNNQVRANGGVKIANILRYNDDYLNNYYRTQLSEQAKLNAQLDGLGDLANILNDLNDDGIDSQLSKFYEALNNLNKYPASSTARTNFIETAKTMTSVLNSKYEQLQQNTSQALGDGESEESLKNSKIYVQYSAFNSKLEELAAVNKALISRSMVIKLEPLTEENIYQILKNALVRKDGLGEYNIKIEDSTLRKIANIANGDVRTALNGLEVAVLTTNMESDGYIHITDEVIKNSVQNRKALFDKNGDTHYDNISAFIKSMRGSDPDATLFYLARAINAGEDPVFIARRIVIAAAEDVGMANPNALVVATSAMQSITMIGMPEARIILAEAAVYVATSPKSNAAYLGIDKALADVTTKDTGTIPMHIRNAPAEGMKNEGYGVGYKYPHDYPMHQVEQQYLPDKMLGTKYYIKDDTVN